MKLTLSGSKSLDERGDFRTVSSLAQAVLFSSILFRSRMLTLLMS